jgi:hypothetical protein
MTARVYAQIVGVVLLLLGVLGLLLGDGLLLGLVNIDIVEDIIHLITGGLLAYVGFGQRDEGVARTVLVGLLGFVVPDMLGLLQHGYTVGDNLVHLLLGILGLVAVFASGRSGTTTSRA